MVSLVGVFESLKKKMFSSEMFRALTKAQPMVLLASELLLMSIPTSE